MLQLFGKATPVVPPGAINQGGYQHSLGRPAAALTVITQGQTAAADVMAANQRVMLVTICPPHGQASLRTMNHEAWLLLIKPSQHTTRPVPGPSG